MPFVVLPSISNSNTSDSEGSELARDKFQNLKLISKDVSNKVVVEFDRNLVTGDEADQEVDLVEAVNFFWALVNDDDTPVRINQN